MICFIIHDLDDNGQYDSMSWGNSPERVSPSLSPQNIPGVQLRPPKTVESVLFFQLSESILLHNHLHFSFFLFPDIKPVRFVVPV